MIDLNTPPLQVSSLLPKLDGMLLELLKSLTSEEWHLPTIAKKWKVKDVAAHLLDGSLRGLSTSRDNWFAEQVGNAKTHNDIINYINQINMDWVIAARRLSPTVLITLLEFATVAYTDHLQSLNPYDEAVFGVSWAGQQKSQNWLHVAREYTEKFLHQQQIRDAVCRPALLTKEFYVPFLDIIMYALPVTYKDIPSPEGSVVSIHVPSDAGGRWSVIKSANSWILSSQPLQPATATVTIHPNIVWQLFSKSVSPGQVTGSVTIEGDETLGLVALNTISFMA